MLRGGLDRSSASRLLLNVWPRVECVWFSVLGPVLRCGLKRLFAFCGLFVFVPRQLVHIFKLFMAVSFLVQGTLSGSFNFSPHPPLHPRGSGLCLGQKGKCGLGPLVTNTKFCI